jgi:outer membrane autotransporter protein
VTFNDGKSGRIKVGAKAGGNWVLGGGTRVEPYVMAAIGHEFHGSNSVFLDSGPGVTVNDNVGGVFGEIGGGVTIAGQGGWSAFVNGKYTIGNGYHGGIARVGARFAF